MAKKAIRDLVKGDMIDLENDLYANPKHDNPTFDCEYAVVTAVELETDDCVCVWFDGFVCGFPANHVVTVAD